MFNGKSLTDFANPFSPHNIKKNDKDARLFFEIEHERKWATCVLHQTDTNRFRFKLSKIKEIKDFFIGRN